MSRREDKLEREEREETVRILSALPTFAGVPAADLAALAAVSRRLHLRAGWTIMAADTPADSAYVIVDGTTVVTQGETVLTHLGPGSVVGEVAMLQGRLRTATVTAQTPLTVLRLGYDDFAPLLADHPALKAVVDKEHAEHLRHT